MIDRDGGIVDTWPSRHLPLGVVDSDEIDPQPERRSLRRDTQLMLYLDGAIEALDDRDIAFGEPALLRALAAAPPGARLEAVKLAVVEHLAGRASEVMTSPWRCSIVALNCVSCGAPSNPDCAGAAGAWQGVWELSLLLESERLKSMDMVPTLQEFLGRIDPQWARDQATLRAFRTRRPAPSSRAWLQLDAQIKAARRPQCLCAGT